MTTPDDRLDYEAMTTVNLPIRKLGDKIRAHLYLAHKDDRAVECEITGLLQYGSVPAYRVSHDGRDGYVVIERMIVNDQR